MTTNEGNRLVLCTATDWYSVRQQIGTLYGNRLVLCTATDWYSVSFRGLLRQQIGTLFLFVAFYGNRLVLCFFSWPSTATDWYSVSLRGFLRQQFGLTLLCFFVWFICLLVFPFQREQIDPLSFFSMPSKVRRYLISNMQKKQQPSNPNFFIVLFID